MDRLESLSSTLSQITMYDIKSMYNQAKNVVLNISEMEAKVREATNDDPWGASSTLMQEIAQGTFNFQQFNEIMPCIYSRFMEKEARQWRQIYKALQLLEYMIKHGSERVVDDARSHISTLKMLRSFHYIDEKGKDEGINVRNRAKELVELLSDVEKIRGERRKAKANKSKYIGVGSDGGFGSSDGMSSFNSGGRYGGFGSDSLGSGSPSYGGDYYGSGGGGGSGSSRMGSGSGGGFSDSSGRRQYEEYDAGGDEISTPRPGSSPPVHRSNSLRTPPTRKSSAPPTRTTTTTTTVPAPAAPIPDLLIDDDVPSVVSPVPATGGLATNKALPKPVGLDDDDFDDFQAAPVQTPVAVPAPAPITPVTQTGAKPNLFQMINAQPQPSQPQPKVQQPGAGAFGGMGMGGGGTMHRPTGSMGGMQQQQQQQNMFGATTMKPTSMGTGMGMGGASPMLPTPMRANATSSPITATPGQQQKKPAVAGGFDDLWNMSLASSGKSGFSSPTSGQQQGQGKSIKDLEKEKATAGLWGSSTTQARPSAAGGTGMGGAGFGNFGSGSGGSGNAGQDDDLLL